MRTPTTLVSITATGIIELLADERNELWRRNNQGVRPKSKSPRFDPGKPRYTQCHVSGAVILDDNPLVWMIEIDGFLIDMLHAPREMQIAAYENGLIPYVPSEQPDKDENSRPPK